MGAGFQLDVVELDGEAVLCGVIVERGEWVLDPFVLDEDAEDSRLEIVEEDAGTTL